MPEDLPLEPDLIKVLASDTRREVLRLLRDRRMTVTELARELDLRKATIHEHLGKLADAGLVERDDQDDRLWVYYELTGEGKRILNPQRTRFYLVVGVGILSVLVLALAAALFFQAGTGPSQSPDAFTVDLANDQAATTHPRLEASIQGVDSNEQLQAYLLTPEEAQQLRQGEPTQGIPLQVTPTSTQASADTDRIAAEADDQGTASDASTAPTRATFETTHTIPAGTYHVYVRTANGEDNRNQMPTLRVSELALQLSSTTLYPGLSAPLNITLTEGQAPAQGRIVITPAQSEGIHFSLPLQDGTTQLKPKQLDQLDPGNYQLYWAPTPQGPGIPLQELHIRQPSIHLTPQHAPHEQRLNVTVKATGTHGQALSIKAPETAGATILSQHRQANAWHLQLAPTDPHQIQLGIGRLAEENVTLYTPLNAHLVQTGNDWTLTLENASDEPLPNAAVSLDDERLGTTNTRGELTFPAPTPGTHGLTIEQANGQRTHRVITGDTNGWSSPRPSIKLQGDLLDPRSSPVVTLQATLTVTNGSQVPATLTVQVNENPVETKPFTLTPKGQQTLQLDLPGPLSPTSSLQLTITQETPLTIAFGDSLRDPDQPTPAQSATTAETTLSGEATAAAEGAPEAPTAGDAEAGADGEGSSLQEPVNPDDGPSTVSETPSPNVALLLVAVLAAAAWQLRRRG